MVSKEFSVICGGDVAGPETTSNKSILNTSHESHKSGKSVKIVEPTAYVCEKKIREIRLRVDALIIEQIEKRKEGFEELKNTFLPSKLGKALKILRWLFLLWLLLTMVKASLCHSRNCHCEVFWYESVLAAVFGIFTWEYRDAFPT